MYHDPELHKVRLARIRTGLEWGLKGIEDIVNDHGYANFNELDAAVKAHKHIGNARDLVDRYLAQLHHPRVELGGKPLEVPREEK